MTANTANPHGAQAHTRAMSGTRVEAMPIVPASDAVGLPPGISPDDAVWEETIASGGYASRQLARGTRLRLVDLHGDACVSALLFNAERPVDRKTRFLRNAARRPESSSSDRRRKTCAPSD